MNNVLLVILVQASVDLEAHIEAAVHAAGSIVRCDLIAVRNLRHLFLKFKTDKVELAGASLKLSISSHLLPKATTSLFRAEMEKLVGFTTLNGKLALSQGRPAALADLLQDLPIEGVFEEF